MLPWEQGDIDHVTNHVLGHSVNEALPLGCPFCHKKVHSTSYLIPALDLRTVFDVPTSAASQPVPSTNDYTSIRNGKKRKSSEHKEPQPSFSSTSSSLTPKLIKGRSLPLGLWYICPDSNCRSKKGNLCLLCGTDCAKELPDKEIGNAVDRGKESKVKTWLRELEVLNISRAIGCVTGKHFIVSKLVDKCEEMGACLPDDLMAAVFNALSALLSDVSPFDYGFIANLLRKSLLFKNTFKGLLRNDSMTDILARSDLFFALFSLVKQLAQSACPSIRALLTENPSDDEKMLPSLNPVNLKRVNPQPAKLNLRSDPKNEKKDRTMKPRISKKTQPSRHPSLAWISLKL
jgi:hypothetical protein